MQKRCNSKSRRPLWAQPSPGNSSLGDCLAACSGIGIGHQGLVPFACLFGPLASPRGAPPTGKPALTLIAPLWGRASRPGARICGGFAPRHSWQGQAGPAPGGSPCCNVANSGAWNALQERCTLGGVVSHVNPGQLGLHGATAHACNTMPRAHAMEYKVPVGTASVFIRKCQTRP